MNKSGEVAEWTKAADSKSVVRSHRTGGSNPPLSAISHRAPCGPRRDETPAVCTGEVTEWPKVHDWKSCVAQATEGSNPSLSATLQAVRWMDSGNKLEIVVDGRVLVTGFVVNPARSGRKQR